MPSKSDKSDKPAQHGPARAVVTRSPKRKVGAINCKWFQDAHIEHESALEKRFVHCALLCLGVIRIEHQPFKMILASGRYTPDFLLHFASGAKAVVEVKPQKKVGHYQTKFSEASVVLAEADLKFYVLTDLEIDQGDKPLIAAEILRYGKSELASEEVDRLRMAIRQSSAQELKIQALVEAANVTIEHVYHLLALRELALHPNDYLHGDSRVLPVPAGPHGLQMFEKAFGVEVWKRSEDQDTPKARRDRIRRKPPKSSLPYVRRATAKKTTLRDHPLHLIAGGLSTHRERGQSD